MHTTEMTDDDERPEAVRRAEMGTAAWRVVVHVQQTATPDRADFYALAGHLVDTLAAVQAVSQVLARQVATYVDRVPLGMRAHDDTRAIDPAERLAAAELALDDLSTTLVAGLEQANRFWSEIGHIGVEDAPPLGDPRWLQ